MSRTQKPNHLLLTTEVLTDRSVVWNGQAKLDLHFLDENAALDFARELLILMNRHTVDRLTVHG